jgi:hypothetical protein
MRKLRPPGRRALLAGILTAAAAGTGVWAQTTDVTLTKTERDQLSGTYVDSSIPQSAWISAWSDTIAMPPAPDVTNSWVEFWTSGANCSSSGWALIPSDVVNVNPNATTGSVNVFMPAFGAPSGTAHVQASASSSNPGPPNETTSNWDSLDHTISVTTHLTQFQNVADDGKASIDIGTTSCLTNAPLASGFLYHTKQETHVQQKS